MSTSRPLRTPEPGDAAGDRKRPRSPSTIPSATPDGRRPSSAFSVPVSIPPISDDASTGVRDANSTPLPSPSRMSAEGTDRLSAAVYCIPADLGALRGAVRDGADVMVDLTQKGDKSAFFGYPRVPALSLLIRRGELEAVLACLESPAAIDFTRTSVLGTTPIHEIALAYTAGWPEYNQRLLSAAVDRIARHPSDKVDWSMMTRYGRRCEVDLLSIVAEHQLLSVFWPVLQSDVSFFADQTESIPLTDQVWAVDWAALGPEEQRYFNKENAQFIDADEATSRLWISCQRYPEPDYTTIRRCLAAGADVMLKCGRDEMPMLTCFIRYSLMEVVQCLLNTPHGIDFTVGDFHGWTPLHWVTVLQSYSEEVRRLLHLLLDRIEQYPQKDIVDWGKNCYEGFDPISTAAAHGHLAPFAEVVFHERSVPYYTDRPGKIKITSRAFRFDVKRLPVADFMRFDFTRGIL